MKLTRFITTISFLLITYFANSQVSTEQYTSPYKKAIGIKLNPGAISYRSFYTRNKAVEGMGFISIDGFQLTILNEKYTPFANAENLTWYIGYGGHFNLWSERYKLNNPTKSAGVAVGVDGMLGLDYKLKNTPINLSVDIQPAFNFVGASYFDLGWGGIGIRYTLK
ncbi:MAG: hypothetical protein EXR15_01055 [Chitinophagaceae bacterium]|nr:hypothetical protein [Chitinophagaceae bacterium]